MRRGRLAFEPFELGIERGIWQRSASGVAAHRSSTRASSDRAARAPPRSRTAEIASVAKSRTRPCGARDRHAIGLVAGARPARRQSRRDARARTRPPPLLGDRLAADPRGSRSSARRGLPSTTTATVIAAAAALRDHGHRWRRGASAEQPRASDRGAAKRQAAVRRLEVARQRTRVATPARIRANRSSRSVAPIGRRPVHASQADAERALVDANVASPRVAPVPCTPVSRQGPGRGELERPRARSPGARLAASLACPKSRRDSPPAIKTLSAEVAMHDRHARLPVAPARRRTSRITDLGRGRHPGAQRRSTSPRSRIPPAC
jgi:hypothetical protein